MDKRTKLRTMLLVPVLLTVTMPAEAALDLVYYGCGCGSKAWGLQWEGPWEHPNIYLEYSANGTNWEVYTGYLPHSGEITSPVYNMYYQMRACTGQLCAEAGFAYVPTEPCGELDG